MLFIAGYHASGKSTAALHLEKLHGFLHSERSVELNAAKAQSNTELAFREWRTSVLVELGKFGLEEIIISSVRNSFNPTIHNGIVVTGNRSLEEIHYISEQTQDIDPTDPVIVAIRVEEPLLFSRYIQRARPEDENMLNAHAFAEMVSREKVAGIETIFDNATHTLYNNSDTETLLGAIEAIAISTKPHQH